MPSQMLQRYVQLSTTLSRHFSFHLLIIVVDGADRLRFDSKVVVLFAARVKQVAHADPIKCAHNKGFCVSTADTTRQQLQFAFQLRFVARRNCSWSTVACLQLLHYFHLLLQADGTLPVPPQSPVRCLQLLTKCSRYLSFYLLVVLVDKCYWPAF